MFFLAPVAALVSTTAVEAFTLGATTAVAVNRLKKKGFEVMLYTNGDGYKNYIAGNLDGEYLWLCSFKSPGTLHKQYGHKIQQYSHWGTVDGVKGEVDLNVFNGSRGEWEKWLAEVDGNNAD